MNWATAAKLLNDTSFLCLLCTSLHWGFLYLPLPLSVTRKCTHAPSYSISHSHAHAHALALEHAHALAFRKNRVMNKNQRAVFSHHSWFIGCHHNFPLGKLAAEDICSGILKPVLVSIDSRELTTSSFSVCWCSPKAPFFPHSNDWIWVILRAIKRVPAVECLEYSHFVSVRVLFSPSYDRNYSKRLDNVNRPI